METPRVLTLIGGMLILVGLLLGLAVVSGLSSAGISISDPLIPLGFAIGLLCMLVLVLSEDSLLLLVAGIVGTISSFLLVGGIVGGIGGILGIVGGALMSGEGAYEGSLDTFESASAPTSTPEQHFLRCPRCGYLNKADSVFCGQCKYPLSTVEKSQA